MAKHSFHQPDRVIKVAFRLFEVIAKHRQAVFLIQEICFITGAFLRQLIYRRIRIDCIAALCSPRTCGFELRILTTVSLEVCHRQRIHSVSAMFL